MAHHAHARLRLVAASAVLAAGLSPLLPSPAMADTPQETVVPATLRATYTSGSVYGGSSYDGHDGAGALGVFHSLEGSGLVWTRYADGTSVKVVHPEGYSSYATAGGDVLAYRYADGRVDLWNAADGTTRTIRTPDGLTLLTAYRDLAVAYRSVRDDSGTVVDREMHLLFPQDDGSTRDVPVTGVPEGYVLGQPKGGDADGLLFLAGKANGPYVSVMVDRRTGEVRSWTQPRSKVYLRAQVTAEHVVLFNLDDPTVQVFSRSDLSAAPVEVTLDGGGANPAQDLAVVGDWLVTRPGTAVIAKPVAGGPSTTLLPASNPHVSAALDGGALAVGRTAAAQDDWGVQRIQPGPDGSPVVTQVKALPKPPYEIQGLSLDQGRLVVADPSRAGVRDTYGRTVAATGTPTFGARSSFDGTDTLVGSCPVTDVGCSQLFGTADGRTAWLERESGQYDRLRVNGPGQYDFWERSVPAGGRITDVSGAYLIYTTAAQQYVYKLDDAAAPAVTRTPGPAALSGDVLWTAGATPGTVTAYDLTARKTVETLTTDAGCSPTELQALGRWLYWNCGDTAGVYDRMAKKSVPVPADEAELGDGYVVTHDKRAGKLRLTTVADGTAASRVIGDLPDTGVSQRGVRWTVDESGANAAYVDGEEQVHLVPSGVAQQPLHALGPVWKAGTVDTGLTDPAFYPLTTVLLSKPAASRQLTVRDKATSKVVDTEDGGPARGELRVGWDGVNGTKILPNGSYTWTLSVTPADGVGAALTTQGTVQLAHGSAVHHDYVGGAGLPDGIGDLLTLNSSGALTYQRGTGKGTFTTDGSGRGWATTIKAVPVGDLSGDRCNDVLVRLSSGALRLYKPGCNALLTPSTSYTTLATTGWNQYDVLTAPGDVTKDGRPDLIARNSSTGAVYLYKGTNTGKLSARVKLYDNWKTYKKVVGAGDLNGDGIGDLVAQDKANNLYRYYGKGNGTFSARAKIFAGWGSSYNAVVGVGDITGDGKTDLVARDTAGVMYRLPGNGKGSFGSRVKISSGWQGYKGIF
ncbi:FG-GAP repeat domain-containing protein [Streptomyces sp. NPDC049687]|uniref:FG-GAP repeat domain-containing protein n=1 Tax=Streptomyces sp. NPDC049687 TaxID=3365596 RepID=UPI0037A9B997